MLLFSYVIKLCYYLTTLLFNLFIKQKFNEFYYKKYILTILFNGLYSSMVERNTVNILINVRFILEAK
jgi:hypothetical protein